MQFIGNHIIVILLFFSGLAKTDMRLVPMPPNAE